MKVLVTLSTDGRSFDDQLSTVADELSRGKTAGKTFDVLDPFLARLSTLQESMQGVTSDQFESLMEDYDTFVAQLIELIAKGE